MSEEAKRPKLTSQVSGGAKSVLFPGRRVTVGRQVLIRGSIAVFCLALTTALVYAGRNGYSDSQNPSQPITLLDSFYFATVSLSTTGYGDIVPATDANRLISALIITPLRCVPHHCSSGAPRGAHPTHDGAVPREALEESREGPHDHRRVWRQGRSATQALIDNGTHPDQIVVISPDRRQSTMRTRWFIGIVGDGRRDDVLERASVATSARAIVATDHDDKAVLMTLNIRRLAPQAAVVVAVRESQHAPVLRQSGANAVITTAEAAGSASWASPSSRPSLSMK